MLKRKGKQDTELPVWDGERKRRRSENSGPIEEASHGGKMGDPPIQSDLILRLIDRIQEV